VTLLAGNVRLVQMDTIETFQITNALNFALNTTTPTQVKSVKFVILSVKTVSEILSLNAHNAGMDIIYKAQLVLTLL
jgi:hypothetical protein